MPKAWFDNQQELPKWIQSRIWPKVHLPLENAFLNYSAVLEDFLNVFSKHMVYEENQETIFTDNFYNIDEFNRKKYAELSKQYNEHVYLVNDLFFELTRAINYICDKVHETIFKGYRLIEGALSVERMNVMVGYDLINQSIQTEYRGQERTSKPYPGLEEFKKVRYTRDLYIPQTV